MTVRSRCRSAHHAQTTKIGIPIAPVHAIIPSLGGGGEKGTLAQRMVNTPTSAQNATVPIRSFALVVRR